MRAAFDRYGCRAISRQQRRQDRLQNEGGAAGGRCTGEVLGRASVNIGSGKWRFEQAVSGAPSEVCVSSAGGGIRTARL